MRRLFCNILNKIIYFYKGSFSGVKTFRDFLYSEKNVLVPEKKLYNILKTDENFIVQMRPAKNFKLRRYDVRSFGNLVQEPMK